MLQVGRLGCPGSTHGCPVAPNLLNWTRAHFAAFAIVSSPLVLSVVPTDEVMAPILDIIGNKQAMAINQVTHQEGQSSASCLLGPSRHASAAQAMAFTAVLHLWPCSLCFTYCLSSHGRGARVQAWAGHPGTLVATLRPATPPCPACAEAGTAVVGIECDASDKTQQGWAFDAAAGHITHGGLCLSAQEWGIPLNLYSCGNASTHQNFTYDAKALHFQTRAPANGKGMYHRLRHISIRTGILD
jgi:hypothetical protein